MIRIIRVEIAIMQAQYAQAKKKYWQKDKLINQFILFRNIKLKSNNSLIQK